MKQVVLNGEKSIQFEAFLSVALVPLEYILKKC